MLLSLCSRICISSTWFSFSAAIALYRFYFLYFCPWLVKNLASAVGARESLVKISAGNFFLALKALVCCHFIQDNTYLTRIFYCRFFCCTSRFPLIFFSRRAFRKMGISASFF